MSRHAAVAGAFVALLAMRRPVAPLLAALALVTTKAGAGDFDARGLYQPAAARVVFESFEQDPAISCDEPCVWEQVEQGDELALDGARWVRVSSGQASFDVGLDLPRDNASYRFRAWVRHSRARVRAVFEYTSGRDVEVAYMFPSGRVTSDGWLELESNAASVTGRDLASAFLRIEGSSVDLDAIEVVPDGSYAHGGSCLGAFDPICGPEAACIAERCRQGDRYVPPLPAAEHRESVVGYLMARVRYLFGGRFSRQKYMPAALAEMEKMRTATSAWQFWSAFGRGVSLLNDWHTSASSAIEIHSSPRRFGVCFIEGIADLSQQVWPSQTDRADVLISHVGPDNNLGLTAGDRLIAVDGAHPIDWARSLISVQWSHHRATDPDVDAELVEALRSLIPKYAKSFTVLRCDQATLTCAAAPETMSIDEIPAGEVMLPGCDNRPFYHLQNPPEDWPGGITTYHYLPFVPWRDLLVDSQPGENIYGMTFDNLYGTSQGLTPYFLDSNAKLKASARGVILDHRAGNGGTRDAPQAITQLVRAPLALSVGPVFMMTAADDGPANAAEGVARFEKLKGIESQLYQVGSNAADTALPVALIVHRDGSASDWLPHGMKGAPNVRIFGPHETAGAFSSFYNFSYWSRLDFQMASGDTISFEGETLIGRGVEPDEIVEHTQSSLLSGKDLPYEAALAWVREKLK
jgi:hypothetical protein